MSDPDLSWMNNLDGTLRPEFGGAQYPVDLSWMNNLDGMLRPEFSGTPYPAAPAPVPNDADKNALAYLTNLSWTHIAIRLMRHYRSSARVRSLRNAETALQQTGFTSLCSHLHRL
jgi:hypothetical protein